MKHSKLSTTTLLSMLNDGCTLTARSRSNIVKSAILTCSSWQKFRDEKMNLKASNWKGDCYFPTSLRKVIPGRGHKDVDIGILTTQSDSRRHETARHLQFLEICPAACTNEALCDCMTDYENAGGDCPSIITAACKNSDELENCTPDAERLAMATYLYCPKFECFESKGVRMEDDIESYLECQCEAYTNLCQECEKLKDSASFCEELITNYGELCAAFVECCSTETSVDGLMKCNDMLINVEVLSQEPSINATIVDATEAQPPDVDSMNKEETSDFHASGGQNYVGRKQMAATTFLIAGSIGYSIYNFL